MKYYNHLLNREGDQDFFQSAVEEVYALNPMHDLIADRSNGEIWQIKMKMFTEGVADLPWLLKTNSSLNVHSFRANIQSTDWECGQMIQNRKWNSDQFAKKS